MRGRVFAGAFIALLTITLLPLGQAEQDPPRVLEAPFSPNVRVNSGNPTYLYQVEPTMAINSQGRIFVGWKEAFTHNGGGQRVSFSYSTDDGATWAPNVLMPLQTYGMQSDPWLTVTADDRVFFSRIAYDGTTVPGGIVISETSDGVSWGPSRLLDDAPRFADKQTHAHDAAGNVYMVWNSDDVAAGQYQLDFSRSDDGGATWTPKVRVPDDANGHLGGFVKVHPDGTVLATWWSWANENVWFDRSLDGGVTWGADVRVNDIAGSAESPLGSDPPILPAMAVAPDGTIYVVWEDYRNARPGGVPNGNMDIMFSRSADGGVTWSPARRLNDDTTTARQWMPDLAIDPAGGIHAAWMDHRDGIRHVYYVNSTDGGTTWGSNVRVTDAGTSFSYTRPGDYLAIESDRSGGIHVVWTDGRLADLDIFYSKLAKTTTVTVDTIPGGRIVEVEGVLRTTPYAFECDVGRYYTIAAPTPQGGSPTRYVFSLWSDGGAQTHQFLCASPETYVAVFLVEHELSIATSPPNLEFVIDGISYSTSSTFWRVESVGAIVDTPSPQGGGTTRYTFASWSDGGLRSHAVVVSGPMTLIASFQTQFFLEISSPYGTFLCDSPDCWYVANATANFGVSPLLADGTPGTRYVFTGWMGDSNETTASASVLMDGPRVVGTVWETEHELTVASPQGTTAGAGWYRAKSDVSFSVSPTTVDGSPGTRYVFQAWTGASTANTSGASVRMDGPRTLTASWGTEYELTIVSTYGTPIGAGWHPQAVLVNVSVEAEVTINGTTYRFAGWTGDVESADPAFGTVMTGPKRIVAVWVEVPRPRTGPGLSVLDWWAWLIALAVILMLIVLFAWRRRRKEEDPPPPPQAE
jgi:hypothetical protein